VTCKEIQVRGLLSGVDPFGREPLAPLVWRIMALALDNLVTVGVAIPFFGVLIAIAVQNPAGNVDASFGCFQLVMQGVMIVFPLLYEGFMLQARAQTLGKMALRIRVTAADGSPIARKHAWVRALIRMLVNFCCVLIDYASAFFRKDRATIHDMAASTSVRRCTGYGGVSCPKCGRAMRHEAIRTGNRACPGCGASLELVRFDPPARPVRKPEAVALAAGDAAPCAKHAGNRTTGDCKRCGHFLCDLCRVEEDGTLWCLSCFGKMLYEGERPTVFYPAPNYVGYAAVCAILASLLMFLGPPVAVVGFYFCIRAGIGRPSQGDGPSGWAVTKAVLGNLFALAIGVFWIIGFWQVVSEGIGEDFPW
jgi:uncharacterized RDD family membrane protein YckC